MFKFLWPARKSQTVKAFRELNRCHGKNVLEPTIFLGMRTAVYIGRRNHRLQTPNASQIDPFRELNRRCHGMIFWGCEPTFISKEGGFLILYFGNPPISFYLAPLL